jgi:SPASM domain peptide maturase of grasp-with-spasm system
MSYFSILPSSIITIGAKKSCIVDIEKSIFCQIPNSMAKFFIENKSFKIENIISSLSIEDRDVFLEYVNFLVINKFGIKTNFETRFKYFTEFDKYDSPFIFENIIIDANSQNDLINVLTSISGKQLYNSIQFRMFFRPDYDFLLFLINYLDKGDFLKVELILNYNFNITTNSYKHILNEYSTIISKIIVMGATQNKKEEGNRLIFLKEELVDAQHCGKVSKDLFMTNIESYLQSCTGNSCLHRKLSIDSKGYVKNCPSMKNSYGHISEISLTTIINKPGFKDLWDIKKEDVDVCKDCEFRRICTDCRAMIKDPDNIYSQPSNCEYNPYIAKWKGEEEWISVEEWRYRNPNWITKSY